MVGACLCVCVRASVQCTQTDIYAFFFYSEGAIFSMCYKCSAIWMKQYKIEMIPFTDKNYIIIVIINMNNSPNFGLDIFVDYFCVVCSLRLHRM